MLFAGMIGAMSIFTSSGSDYDSSYSSDYDYDDDYDDLDDVELDRRHAALYGGDRMYCDCGTKLKMNEWGGYCPKCEPEMEFDSDVED